MLMCDVQFMIRSKSLPSFLGLVSAFSFLAGCDSDDAHDPNDDVSALLARAETPEGVELQFRQLESGAILVSEYGPADAPSPIVYFNSTERVTPLELFLAVAPSEQPPRALVERHESAMREVGRPLTPRALTLPDPSFRSTSDDYYNTNCSAASDEAWFDYWWDALGFGFHDWWSGILNDDEQATDLSPTTTSFITHLCLWNVEDIGGDPIGSVPVQHVLKTDAGFYSPIFGQYVYIAHRSVLWIWDESDQYQGWTNSAHYAWSELRLGAMAD